MTTKQERLKEVYNHLRNYFGVHTQIDFAEAIRITRPALSSAMNGNEKYLTKNLFQKICAAFPGVFDLNYLLTGEGSLLATKEEVHNEEYENLYNPQSIDQSSLMNATIAAQMKTIEILEAQAVEKDIRIAELKDTIASKEEIIKAREARIVELERQLAAAATSDLSRYPFSFGAADGHNLPDVSPNP
jgi:transcriptional regulator with XRE-family HTH domain